MDTTEKVEKGLEKKEKKEKSVRKGPRGWGEGISMGNSDFSRSLKGAGRISYCT